MELSDARILLVGSQGMLGLELQKKLAAKRVDFYCADLKGLEGLVHALDIADQDAVNDLVRDLHPNWVINCAAYTNVDLAEKEQELAFLVNSVGPANLARACLVNSCKLLHISTDYVFAGNSLKRNTPWREDDKLSPKGTYAQSKRFGEELVRSILSESSYIVVRTSWLYGEYGANFVNTMLHLGEEKEEVSVVFDQVGSPTWTNWLSDIILTLIELDAQGIFHASSRGDISWFDFAKAIFELAKLSTVVMPVTTEQFARPAPRPAYSTLDVSKLETFLSVGVPDWKDQLADYLKQRSI